MLKKLRQIFCLNVRERMHPNRWTKNITWIPEKEAGILLCCAILEWSKTLLQYWLHCWELDFEKASKQSVEFSLCHWRPRLQSITCNAAPFLLLTRRICNSRAPLEGRPAALLSQRITTTSAAWCGEWSHAAKVAGQASRHTRQVKQAWWRAMEEWLWAGEHLYPRQGLQMLCENHSVSCVHMEYILLTYVGWKRTLRSVLRDHHTTSNLQSGNKLM